MLLRDARGRRPYPELLPDLGLLASEALPGVTGDLADSRLLLDPPASVPSAVPDRGLGGKLETRCAPFGGKGNAPMLEVFLRVLPGVGREDAVWGELAAADFDTADAAATAVFRVGTAGDEYEVLAFGVGRLESVTDLDGNLDGVDIPRPVPAVLGRESSALSVDEALLVFDIGKAGNGPDGGAASGGRGKVEVIETAVDILSYAASREPDGYALPAETTSFTLPSLCFV